MTVVQSGVLAPVPSLARYLTFTLQPHSAPREALIDLKEIADGNGCVIGIGKQTLRALGADIPGMRPFPTMVGDGYSVPTTPAALWCWLRSNDRGELIQRDRALRRA